MAPLADPAKIGSANYLVAAYDLPDLALLTGICERRWMFLINHPERTRPQELRTIVIAAHRDHANEKVSATPHP